MGMVLWDHGILRFGVAPPDWIGSYGGWSDWKGNIVIEADAVADEHVGGYDTSGADQMFGTWIVNRSDSTRPDLANARVVDSPLFDSIQDISVMRLRAMPGRFVWVQSRALQMPPLWRDIAGDGSWPEMKADAIAQRDTGPGGAGPLTARVDAYFFDKTGLVGVGSPVNIWTATPPTTFAAPASWPAFTPDVDACYFAIRLMLTVDSSASGMQVVYFREPAIGFQDVNLNITTNDFKARYISY